MKIKQSVLNKVAKANHEDNTLLVEQAMLMQSPGYTTMQMKGLGLSKLDLKHLEVKGIALRGYSKNIWLTGETLPNGKVVPEGQSYRGRGSQVRWVLVKEAYEAATTKNQKES